MGGDTDAVTIALLVAAKSGAQQYRISKWGEDSGVGSAATFSRKKNNLEDDSVITTEKVPDDIGRPRYCLQLIDKYALRSQFGVELQMSAVE
ncbi:hypothetical protein GWK26_00600 [haloarchaeon 3A1-DGR]|nr:hypothetical protein GWK26_00600 [haloarchaeon 3A1-DGR]